MDRRDSQSFHLPSSRYKNIRPSHSSTWTHSEQLAAKVPGMVLLGKGGTSFDISSSQWISLEKLGGHEWSIFQSYSPLPVLLLLLLAAAVGFPAACPMIAAILRSSAGGVCFASCKILISAGAWKASAALMKLTACPFAPARPVRPMRCT
mmetsp:Transcript_15436/g.35047  ORF Transcript_15436/g.35047 Transcript_15436/m.35047 type:complete len:150 (-) Transcript_15436:1568-2017(-)